MWADAMSLFGRDSDFMRPVLFDPPTPAEYYRLIIPGMAMDPDEPQGRSVYLQALRMLRGRQMHRTVLPIGAPA